MIVSILEKNAGFFSEIFFLLNHYIHCKNNRIPFMVDSMNWLFKYECGWEDYFENIDLTFEDCNATVQFFKHSQIIEPFTILLNKKYIREIYNYNKNTAYYINQKKIEWGFNAGTIYDSIFIRRGDKLFDESYFIPTEKYIETLLKREPMTNIIVMQTDDYNCVIEAKEYLNIRHPHIKLFSLCKPHTTGGMIIFPRNFAENIKYNSSSKYISANLNNYENTKTVFHYSSAEIYEHTLDLICGVDFVLNSRTCILDMQSNVSRFIRLFRNDNRIIDVVRLKQDPAYFNGERDFNINETLSPAFITSIYPEGFIIDV